MGAQQRAGEQRGDEIAGDELAGLVDEEAAVGVAVEGDRRGRRRSRAPRRSPARGSPAAAGWARGRGSCRPASRRWGSARGPRRSRIGPTVGPAMPLPPSSTTLRPPTEPVSMKAVAAARKPSPQSTGSTLPPPGGAGRPASISVADVADAGVAGQRHRALADQLRAGVGLRVVRGGADQPAVELARADQVVDDLGRDLAGVEHVDALGDQPGAVAGAQLRGGEAHVVAERDAQVGGGLAGELAEHAGERATDLLGAGRRRSGSRRGRGCRRP